MLAKHVFVRVMGSHIVQADDTGLRVLDPSRANGVKKGHLWGFVGDRRLVAFAYTETWEGERAREHLVTRRGYLQVDGFAGLNPLFEGPDPPCVAIGCTAHCRRRFVVAMEGGEQSRPRGAPCTSARSIGAADERARHMDRPHPSGGAAEDSARQGADYAINQWPQLMRFLDDGRIELAWRRGGAAAISRRRLCGPSDGYAEPAGSSGRASGRRRRPG
jgi:hypothetical protein